MPTHSIESYNAHKMISSIRTAQNFLVCHLTHLYPSYVRKMLIKLGLRAFYPFRKKKKTY